MDSNPKPVPTEHETCWDYYKEAFKDIEYKEIYDQIIDRVKANYSRKSCVFTSGGTRQSKSFLFSYSQIPHYNWEEAGDIINKVRKRLEDQFGEKYDYVLAHYYPSSEETKETTKSGLGYHSDNEALDSDVMSISFGSPRKFRFRRKEETSGYTKEYLLGHGDVVHMVVPCQRVYKHSIIAQANVGGRINLTFRKL